MDDDEDLVQRLLTWAGAAMEIASVDAIVLDSGTTIAKRVALTEQRASDIVCLMSSAAGS